MRLTVQDLALKSLSEILFPPSFSAETTASWFIDILREYEGSTESLEAAIQAVGCRV